MTAFYNEIEKYPAAWMDNLIAAGHIASGQVDTRSIVDLEPVDVAAATQAHFFAGIGLWSLALRMAGWPDDLPVWTGSCPCQPFSAAGKRKGKDDERHLWPSWYSLIKECRPPIIFGEQVASDDGLDWFDTVHSDLEGAGYAVGASDLCAAGVGAFHIRQRLYFVAIADSERRDWQQVLLQRGRSLQASSEVAGGGITRSLANADPGPGRQLREIPNAHGEQGRPEVVDENRADEFGDANSIGELGHARSSRPQERQERQERRRALWDEGQAVIQAGPWDDIEWLPCTDGKYRPTKPGLFPLAHGHPNRVGKLRAYGNAISPPVAATFIRAVMESL